MSPSARPADKCITPEELDIQGAIPVPKRTDWRIGLVGFGSIAAAHAKAYASAGWRIVAVADPDPAARERAREMTSADRFYEDYYQLVSDPDVEVVSLLTQPTLREPVVAAAAEAGKPILTEKPLSGDIEECERMIALAERAGIPFAVSQNYRWQAPYFLMHHIIRKGLIGHPFFASIEYYGCQDVTVADRPFYANCDDFLTIQWNNHLADLLRYWFGRDARAVLTWTRRMTGQNFRSDNLLISLADFGENVTGQILHNELLRSSLTSTQCRVDGDEGSVVFAGDLLLQSKQLGDERYRVSMTEAESTNGMRGTMGDLLLSIEETREPLVSARRNLATIRHILAEKKSAELGGVWVSI